jgi:hypothetical protein
MGFNGIILAVNRPAVSGRTVRHGAGALGALPGSAADHALALANMIATWSCSASSANWRRRAAASLPPLWRLSPPASRSSPPSPTCTGPLATGWRPMRFVCQPMPRRCGTGGRRSPHLPRSQTVLVRPVRISGKVAARSPGRPSARLASLWIVGWIRGRCRGRAARNWRKLHRPTLSGPARWDRRLAQGVRWHPAIGGFRYVIIGAALLTIRAYCQEFGHVSANLVPFSGCRRRQSSGRTVKSSESGGHGLAEAACWGWPKAE